MVPYNETLSSLLPQDPLAAAGTSASNPLPAAISAVKSAFPGLVVACDVCLCGYTDHGHCGVLKEDGYIDNEKSVDRLAEIAK